MFFLPLFFAKGERNGKYPIEMCEQGIVGNGNSNGSSDGKHAILSRENFPVLQNSFFKFLSVWRNQGERGGEGKIGSVRLEAGAQG